GRHSRKSAPTPANLDFDARVPIPFSVFPSSYRSDAATTETTQVKVEGEVSLPEQTERVGREGHQVRYSQEGPPPSEDRRYKEEIRVYERDRHRPAGRREEEIRIFEEQQQQHEPFQRYDEAQINVQDRTYDKEFRTAHGPATTYADSQIDVTEREYRQRTRPIVDESRYGQATQDFAQSRYSQAAREQSRYGQRAEEIVDARYSQPDQVRVEATRTTVDPPQKSKRDMGYYDEDGHYHSFRQGLHRAADRILHPIHGHGHSHSHHHHSEPVDREEVIIKDPRASTMAPPNTITIPCHHIRIGDLLILQGRPCQVIRITTSSQTGQHRYLGVDLFTKQLNEESSFISNPAPSVVVQNMLGPVFKQYRVLDIREDGRIVAMTETGDVKQGLPVLDQSSLLKRVTDSFDNGRGSIRVLVISDEGQELVVDYKVVHGSRL
ncbi:hypothetical protein K490DRAFT_46843, partial [Saccharata proteae CBS 121410]